MARRIQVDVPGWLHEELRRRAHEQHLSIADLVLNILEEAVEPRPSIDEVFEGVEGRSSVPLDVPAADLIRQERAGRMSGNDDSSKES